MELVCDVFVLEPDSHRAERARARAESAFFATYRDWTVYDDSLEPFSVMVQRHPSLQAFQFGFALKGGA